MDSLNRIKKENPFEQKKNVLRLWFDCYIHVLIEKNKSICTGEEYV